MPSGHPARYSPPTDPLTLTSQERIETFLTRQDWAIMLSIQTATRPTYRGTEHLQTESTNTELTGASIHDDLLPVSPGTAS